MTQLHSPSTRRDFLKTSAAVTAGVAATTLAYPGAVHAGGNDVMKVGLIGCGGRGTGAAENVLHSAKGVELIAVGDYFQDNANSCRNHLMDFGAKDDTVKSLGNKVDVSQDRCFSGLDAYQKVINTP